MQSTATQLQSLSCPSAGVETSMASLSSRSRRSRRKPSKGSRQGHTVVKAASLAQPLAQNLGPLPLSAEPELGWQQSTWSALAKKLSSGLHRQKAEDHLPLCKAFGVSSLEELQVLISCTLPVSSATV
jgi:hypothetical protein